VIDGQLRDDAVWLRDFLQRVSALLPALHRGIERIDGEIDYSYPANLQVLLENREYTILDPTAIVRLVGEDPGPMYYGDLNLCEEGGSWEQTGGPWADRLEQRLIDLGAIRKSAETTPHDDLAQQVKRALEGQSNDSEHDALVAVAERLGIAWQPPSA
jgi:hypothetical protein